MDKKVEIRTSQGAYAPHLREVEEGESRTIEGYAVVFGVPSEVLCDGYDMFREIIEPGAITPETLAKSDIKMTMYHNREKLLARSNKGEGTLSYEIDATGVKFSFEAPHTQFGDEALELVKRGDISGCSFAFIDGFGKDAVTWEVGDDGVPFRHVNEIAQLFDMTLAADPAYQQTSVSAREAMPKPETQTSEDEEKLLKEKAEMFERERYRRQLIRRINND